MAKRLHNSGFTNWTPNSLNSLDGKIFIVTGGNAGIGFEAAKILSASGAKTVIAARNMDKAMAAAQAVADSGAIKPDVLELDLADTEIIRRSADEVRQRFPVIHALINNAGIMQTPKTITRDGFELQLATNHLGHFLFTGLLFDIIEQASGRIVTISSIAHHYGRIQFDDLMLTRNYSPTRAYCQSKLANLIFAIELQRRLDACNSRVISVACHPGYSATSLQSTGPSALLKLLYKPTNALLAQSAYNGAIPTVLAAAGNEARPGGYYGPQSMRETRGRVGDARVSDAALNKEIGVRLWRESERLVGHEWL
ncbi:MAG: oxidoreductase [Pseudomonadota bacterium]